MNDQLYVRARQLLLENPDLGKKPLAASLNIHPPMARRLKERFRGEREGHRTDALYQQFLTLKKIHPAWGGQRVANALRIKIDIALLLLARFAGAAGTATRMAIPSGQTIGTIAPDTKFVYAQPDMAWMAEAARQRIPLLEAENMAATSQINALLAGMLEQFKSVAPVRPPVRYAQTSGGMLELSLMD